MIEVASMAGAFLTPLVFAIAVWIAAAACALRRSVRWATALGMLATAELWIASAPVTAAALTRYLEMQHPALSAEQTPKADLIVVLGGTIAGAQPPVRPHFNMSASVDRVWHAAELYRAGKAPRVLVAGGDDPAPPGGQTEPEAVVQMLTELGVPRTAILVEDQSRSTRDNAINSRALATASHARSALLVTSALHMPRALKIFRAAWTGSGIDILPAATDVTIGISAVAPLRAWLPDAGALAATTRAWKELAGGLLDSMMSASNMSLQVSVITAVFNRAGTIADALQSVRAQTWQDVEHIVIDGGSSDGSLEILEAHRSRLAQLVSEPDGGLYDALNKGIRQSRGDIVGFMHADDQFASAGALGRVARAFEDPAVGAVYGDLVYVNKHDKSHVVRYWRAGPYSPKRLSEGWMPPHPTFYVRRELYQKLGLFDTRYRIAADYESMLRILGRGGVKAAYVPEILVRMRTGGLSNCSLRNMWIKSSEDYIAMRQNGIGGLTALLRKNIAKLPQFIARAPETSL